MTDGSFLPVMVVWLYACKGYIPKYFLPLGIQVRIESFYQIKKSSVDNCAGFILDSDRRKPYFLIGTRKRNRKKPPETAAFVNQ